MQLNDNVMSLDLIRLMLVGLHACRKKVMLADHHHSNVQRNRIEACHSCTMCITFNPEDSSKSFVDYYDVRRYWQVPRNSVQYPCGWTKATVHSVFPLPCYCDIRSSQSAVMSYCAQLLLVLCD